jgi:hypothetical protein
MGSGVSTSSTVRVRKSIIIRAYNLRKADETIDEQFSIYAKRYDNKLMIKLEDIKACLKIEDGALWSSMVEIFQQCISVNLDGTVMDYRAFREFLLHPTELLLQIEMKQYRFHQKFVKI